MLKEETKHINETEDTEENNLQTEYVAESSTDIIKTTDKAIRRKKLKTVGSVAVFVFILAAGFVGNWYYDNSNISSTIQPLLDSATEKTLGKAELVDATATTVKENDYFSSARIDRQNARDEAMEKLQSVVNDTSKDERAHQIAAQEIAKISGYISIENKIETLVCAKGINNCLAVVSEDGKRVDVIVDTETLEETTILQIKDIATSQLGCSFENVSIIQSK